MEISKEINLFLNDIENLLSIYADRIKELEREKRKKAFSQKLEDEYERRKREERERVIDEINKLVRYYNLEVIGDIFTLEDVSTVSSIMGIRYSSIYYLVCTIKLDEDRALEIYANFTESDVHGDYSLIFNYTTFNEIPILNPQKTPFSHELVKRIPWFLIKDYRIHNIIEKIEEIIKSEWEGEEKLKETIEKVEKELKPSLWIHDYDHFYTTLKEVREKYDI